VHEGEAPAPPARVVTPAVLKAAAESGAHQPDDLGRLLDALREASRALAGGDDQAIPEYNYLTARLVDRLIEAGVRPWNQSLTVRDGSVEYLLRGTEPADLADPGREFIPTDRLRFSGRYARETGRTPGIGAPLVTFLSDRDAASKTIPYRTVTAVVHFEGRRATVDLLDPFKIQRTTVGGREFPLHADFNAPVAYILSKDRIDRLGLARLMNPVRYDDTARLDAVQPYDPEKIPVLLVHGLQDTPASFAPMYFELMDDPAIRERFQFWAFSYPSGYPYPVSAAILRRELRLMEERYPDHKDIVIIGHSMGGLVTRLMVTDVGDRLWRGYFGESPADTPISGESRRLLEASLVFDARDNISRAIFISSPHHGSELASNIVGWIGVKLVRFPATLANIRDVAVSALNLDASGMRVDRFPSSIDTLSPQNGFVKAINHYPVRADIPFHSIMGDRGKGDTPDSSDGVVAYWSSHLDGAVSEKIVPSGHSAHQHPEGIEEVRRILHLHAGIPYQPHDKSPMKSSGGISPLAR
jgi:pimeloyl-ACP methyl ester carboxylesterase